MIEILLVLAYSFFIIYIIMQLFEGRLPSMIYIVSALMWGYVLFQAGYFGMFLNPANNPLPMNNSNQPIVNVSNTPSIATSSNITTMTDAINQTNMVLRDTINAMSLVINAILGLIPVAMILFIAMWLLSFLRDHWRDNTPTPRSASEQVQERPTSTEDSHDLMRDTIPEVEAERRTNEEQAQASPQNIQKPEKKKKQRILRLGEIEEQK